MKPVADDVVTRLYGCLVEELRRRGHDPQRPLPVARLYRDIVPYRAVREAIGVDLNADYEHALLRLLAGESEYVELDSAEARAALRREADSPYPRVSLFRDYAACHALVRMPPGGAFVGETPSGEASSDEAPSHEPPADETPADETVEPSTSMLHDPSAPGSDAPPSRPTPAAGGGGCAACGQALPPGRPVRFCPHCGAEQWLIRCSRCGTELDPEWRYCVGCGEEITGSGRAGLPLA